MTPSHSKVAAAMLLSLTLLAQLTNWVHGNPPASKQLERVLREAEEESKQLAKDIINWTNEQAFKEDHLRVRKSAEEENGEKTAEARGKLQRFDGSNYMKTRRRREASKNKLQLDSATGWGEVKAGHSNTGLVATKGRSNPVLRAFDLMKLLISEREKSLKKSKMNKTSGKMKIGRRAKQGKAVKREKSPRQKKRKNYSFRSATKGSKKSKVLRRTSSGKLASHSNVKRKVKSEKAKITQTRNVVQILKAMPRKQLRNLLKEKGLGKFWNVVKVAPKESVKKQFHGKKLRNVSGKTVKRTHGANKGRKDGKKKSKVTHSENRAHIHKRKSKLSFRKAAPKSKKSKISAINKPSKPSKQNGKKRSKIPRAPNMMHNFQARKEDSRKREEVQANRKFAALKNKIKQTNELKFKVAKALLAHCATENKLRNIFRDVNMSLKKAAVLVEIIGRKLGMEKGDVQKIIKQHPEKAVQQFLSEVF